MADEYKTLPANKKHVTVWDHVSDLLVKLKGREGYAL